MTNCDRKMNLIIGDCVFRIVTCKKHYDYLLEEYSSFVTNLKHDHVIIFEDTNNYTKRKLEYDKKRFFSSIPNETIEYDLVSKVCKIKLKKETSNRNMIYLIQKAVSIVFGLSEDYFSLHASSIIANNKIIGFSGYPNSGKSTIVSLGNWPILDDELLILSFKNKKLTGFTLPRSYQKLKTNKSYEMDKLFFISHGKKNVITPLSEIEKCMQITVNNSITMYYHEFDIETIHKEIFKKSKKFISSLDIYNLKFLKSKKIWKLINERIQNK